MNKKIWLRRPVFFLGVIFLIGCRAIHSPIFSPDGQSIYLIAEGKDYPHALAIYKVGRDGKNPKQLSFPERDSFDSEVHVSRDGSKLVFSRRTFGKEKKKYDVSATQHIKFEHLFLMNADGSDLKQFTDGDFNDVSPVFSADGKTIYFLRSADEYSEPFFIHAIELESGVVTKISKEGFGRMPTLALSPDEQQFLINAMQSGDEVESRPLLFVINRDGSGESEVLASDVVSIIGKEGYGAMHASYSPDGKSIAFAGSRAVYLMDMETKLITKLANPDSSYIRWTSFSPEGKEIIFCTGVPYACNDVWTVNFDGSNLKKLSIKKSLFSKQGRKILNELRQRGNK